MADHFEMDGIADYSIISGLQTTYIQRSTTALNHPICCICQCKFLNNRISGRKWDSQVADVIYVSPLRLADRPGYGRLVPRSLS